MSGKHHKVASDCSLTSAKLGVAEMKWIDPCACVYKHSSNYYGALCSMTRFNKTLNGQCPYICGIMRFFARILVPAQIRRGEGPATACSGEDRAS